MQPYPGPGGKWQISTEGGWGPAWAPNGRELFYREFDNKMMAVDIVTEPQFSAAKPRLLFEGRCGGYDITPDGQRFLMMQRAGQESLPTQINVVLNWFEELKRLVPADQN